MKNRFPETIVYHDELNDDFAGVEKAHFEIPADFRYVRKGILWKILSFFAYRVIMTPFAYLYCKLKLHLKIVDHTSVPLRAQNGCFLYGNHTLLTGDAFVPTLLSFPKKVFVVVSPANIATAGTRNFLLMNGALPLPQSAGALRSFMRAIETRIREGHCVTVYPEAHIWPYYPGIRPFPSASFKFPVKTGAPIYVSTATFQKKRGYTPKVTVYLEGPFYPNAAVSPKEAEGQLRDKAYKVMCAHAEKSTYHPIEYRKGEDASS